MTASLGGLWLSLAPVGGYLEDQFPVEVPSVKYRVSGREGKSLQPTSRSARSIAAGFEPPRDLPLIQRGRMDRRRKYRLVTISLLSPSQPAS